MTIHNVKDAKACHISVIHQELLLEPFLTIAENVFLGSELRNKWGMVDFAEMNRITNRLIQNFGLPFSATTILGSLSIANQQMVEILRAVSFDAQIVIMDEPTSSLTESEVQILFDTIRKLKANNVAVIYISHRLEEIFELADEVSVIRDGKHIKTCLLYTSRCV